MVFVDVGWAPFLDLTVIGDRNERPRNPVLTRAVAMAEGGIEQSGYIDIKQPPRVKGRKLKSWKKKWVVLHEMSILASDRPAAKVDVYADEKTATKCPADKHTFILEYVKTIRAAKSKTHAHAFEIVENEAVLLFAGHTELESQTWISAFRNIFWPHEIENHCYDVTIVQNEYTSRLSLEGAYVMTITPEVIGIESETQNSYEWSLPMLKRFHLSPDPSNSGKEVMVIECGPKSECGQATFLFRSDEVVAILDSIKKNIFTAINMKKCANTTTQQTQVEKKPRHSVISDNLSEERQRSDTLSSSEQHYRELLDPAMPESKRTRLMSNGSVPSMANSDKMSTHSLNEETVSAATETQEFPTKKRHSVTFDTPQEPAKKMDMDILSQPIESNDNEEEDQYNRVLFNTPTVPKVPSNIITTFTIAQPGYQTKVLLDDKGYSHVNFKGKVPVIEDDKVRSLSNISSHSSMSNRSASVGSRDSGIQYQAAENGEQFQREITGNRSSHSFDSAVSTSSAVETTETTGVDTCPTNLKVEIQEIEVDASGQILDSHTDDNGIYQDVSIDEENDAGSENTIPKLMKSNSTGNCKNDENEYEDLDKYQKGKKDLFKHLGMDPNVDPKSVPPALPARPLSQRMKRKFQNHDRKLFTLPFVKNRARKSKEIAASISSSSDSDSESIKDSKANADLSLKKWPLGNKSVIVGNNELYQPIAIERFLNDEDDNVVHSMRERSSSLNLNTSTSLHSESMRLDRTKIVDKKTAMWKHNRNVSMNIEVFQRMNDPTIDSDRKHRLNMTFQNKPVGESLFESEGKMTYLEDERKRSGSNCSSLVEEDDEPIYAEVGPSTKQSDGIAENPFPDIGAWTAPENHSKLLDTTHYENDESMNSSQNGDVFNQGFVTQSKTETNENQGQLLIDFSDVQSDSKDNVQTEMNSTSAVDVFKMEFDPLFSDNVLMAKGIEAPLIPTPSDFVDIFHLGMYTPQTPESCEADIPVTQACSADVAPIVPNADTVEDGANDTIYMDMTTCKNESIYVMPSTLKK